MEKIIKNELNFDEKIYEIGGKQVMFDVDLAEIYQVETKRINEAVKNNPDKFPERYIFKISNEEYHNLKSKFSTSSMKYSYGGSRKAHIAFTEQGIYMLATILKSKVAARVTLNIMDMFVAMRNVVSKELVNSRILLDHEDRLLKLEEAFDSYKENNNQLFFNGQIYDAYSKILKIFNKAKDNLIIIDSYADKDTLDIIKDVNVNAILITTPRLLKKRDIDKYNEQYNNLKIVINKTFHDRYFIIDNRTVYHCGTSINKIGGKTFSINILDDRDVANNLIDRVQTML
ncbi:MAG: ORF6N domain-containing protein [Bacilli bacterium]|nr:ORF6N domain-containing protein [Bacilli bacterium]